jgi:hypothetical protein
VPPVPRTCEPGFEAFVPIARAWCERKARHAVDRPHAGSARPRRLVSRSKVLCCLRRRLHVSRWPCWDLQGVCRACAARICEPLRRSGAAHGAASDMKVVTDGLRVGQARRAVGSQAAGLPPRRDASCSSLPGDGTRPWLPPVRTPGPARTPSAPPPSCSLTLAARQREGAIRRLHLSPSSSAPRIPATASSGAKDAGRHAARAAGAGQRALGPRRQPRASSSCRCVPRGERHGP